MEIQEEELTNTFHLSGEISSNVNNCIEKRGINVTAKHPTDIELKLPEKICMYIYKGF